jgi:hypothetical protein
LSLIMDDQRADGSRWPTILLIVGAGVISAFQAAGWPAVSFLVAAMAGIAALLGLLFRARPAEQAMAS